MAFVYSAPVGIILIFIQVTLNLVRTTSDNLHDLLLHIAQGVDVNHLMAEAVNQSNVLYFTCLLQNGASYTGIIIDIAIFTLKYFPGNFHSNLTLDDIECDRESTVTPSRNSVGSTDSPVLSQSNGAETLKKSSYENWVSYFATSTIMLV